MSMTWRIRRAGMPALARSSYHVVEHPERTRRAASEVLMPKVDRACRFSLLAVVVLALASPAAFADAIISNGVLQMGIKDGGNLIALGGSPSSGTGTTEIGLRYVPTNAEATAAGCACEGWGVGDRLTGLSGYAHGVDGLVNLRVVSFTATASTATSVVDMFDPANGVSVLRVTHAYVPE